MLATFAVAACGDDPVSCDDEVPVPAAAPSGTSRPDIYDREVEEAAVAAMRGVYAVLKRGDIFGVIDPSATARGGS